MLESEYVQANSQLLSAAMTLSPNGTVQQELSALVNALRWDGCSERVLTIALLNTLLDGVQHGNWPI